jgi:hypothetical protein
MLFAIGKNDELNVEGAGDGGNGGVKEGEVHGSLRWGPTSSHLL